MTTPNRRALSESAELHPNKELRMPTGVTNRPWTAVRPSADHTPRLSNGEDQMTLQLVEDMDTIAADGVSAPDPDPAKPDKRFKLWTPQDLIDSNTPPVWTA